MTTYTALTRNARTGKATARTFDSAELAAGQLFVLMRADGWVETQEATVRRLVTGETLCHKRFEYSVSKGDGTA